MKTNRLIYAAADLVKSASKHRIGPYAAQASFFIILSFIPSLMFLISMINYVLPYVIPVSDMEIINQIYAHFPEPLAGVAESIVRDVLEKSSGISVVTAVTSLWFSSRGIMALNQGINNVLSDGELQNYFFVRLMSLVYMFAFSVLVVMTIALLGFGNQISAYLSPILPEAMDVIYRVLHLRWVIVFVILTVFFTLFYHFMPKQHRPFGVLVPGAAVAAAGWLIFTWAFGVYVSLSKSYASVYGSISYLILAMLWLYFCMNILLWGAELSAEFGTLLKTYKKKA